MSEFLNNQELHTLTGYARPITQANWLKERGIVHKVDGKRLICMRRHISSWEVRCEVMRSREQDWGKYILDRSAEKKPYNDDHFDSFEGVYALWNGDDLVYIGKSLSVRSRLLQHYWSMGRGERSKWTHWTAMEVPVHLLDLVETAHITALYPSDNWKIPHYRDDQLSPMVEKIKKAWRVVEND